MDTIRKPSLWLGALVGGLLTMTLMSLLFLADQIAGLPFIPFDVFDFVSRQLPGPLLTFGIDTMVDLIIGFNLGETSSAAKTAELLMGLSAFLALGIVAVTIAFWLMNRSKTTARNLVPGLVLGLGFGVVMMLVSLQVNLTATAPMPAQVIWVLVAFAVWGIAHIYNGRIGAGLVKMFIMMPVNAANCSCEKGCQNCIEPAKTWNMSNIDIDKRAGIALARELIDAHHRGTTHKFQTGRMVSLSH